jgi:hypothetical protein
MPQAIAVDTVMRALADPTRRAVFERVASAREISVVELTRGSGVTQGAISQHLKSLKHAEPQGLAPLVDWMGHYGVFWRARFANLRKLLKEIDP